MIVICFSGFLLAIFSFLFMYFCTTNCLLLRYDSSPIFQALDKCRESPPNDWPAAAYVLVGRQDLAMSCREHSSRFKGPKSHHNLNSICMSTPYMLHLYPVTIPSTFSDTNGLENGKLEDTESVDGSVSDGMEHIFNSSTQLQYGRDLRLNEVIYFLFQVPWH